MVAYATQEDLERKFGVDRVTALADHDRDDVADWGVVEAALDNASRRIDGYLATRYDLPIEYPPAVLQDLCIDIAHYFLGTNALMLTEDMRVRYEDAMQFLKDVSNGKAAIAFDSDDDGLTDEISVQHSARTVFFGRA